MELPTQEKSPTAAAIEARNSLDIANFQQGEILRRRRISLQARAVLTALLVGMGCVMSFSSSPDSTNTAQPPKQPAPAAPPKPKSEPSAKDRQSNAATHDADGNAVITIDRVKKTALELSKIEEASVPQPKPERQKPGLVPGGPNDKITIIVEPDGRAGVAQRIHDALQKRDELQKELIRLKVKQFEAGGSLLQQLKNGPLPIFMTPEELERIKELERILGGYETEQLMNTQRIKARKCLVP